MNHDEDKGRPKIGLALGSGSLRGLAHIGVLQALDEGHIPIDYLCGSSMGAAVGSVYCVGADMGLVAQIICQLHERDMMDFAVHGQGFIKGERIEQIIRTLTGNRTFEQTIIPFCAMATDIVSGKAVRMESGPLHEGVRASISIPGAFVPYMRDGRMLVDGGVVSRVPAGEVREMGADVVIAVDVGYSGQETAMPKSTLEIMMRSIEIIDWELSKRRTVTADVMLYPDTYDINPYSMEKAEKCIENGRIAAFEALPRIYEAIERFKSKA